MKRFEMAMKERKKLEETRMWTVIPKKELHESKEILHQREVEFGIAQKITIQSHDKVGHSELFGPSKSSRINEFDES